MPVGAISLTVMPERAISLTEMPERVISNYNANGAISVSVMTMGPFLKHDNGSYFSLTVMTMGYFSNITMKALPLTVMTVRPLILLTLMWEISPTSHFCNCMTMEPLFQL